MVFGRVRERARERKERAGESEREQGGSGRAAGVVHAARRSSASRRWPGRAPTCIGHAPVPTGARRKATGGEVEMGWAVLGQVSGRQVS